MTEESADLVGTAAAIIGFARALNVRLRETPDGAGLALAELNVLGGIEKGHDLSSTLARALMLDAPRVSRIVESFVVSGYVLREPDPEDRRRSRLRLTPAGREHLADGRADLAAAMGEMLSGLTGEEREGLHRAVPGMRRVLTRRIATADDTADAAASGTGADLPSH